jgi:predicted porin
LKQQIHALQERVRSMESGDADRQTVSAVLDDADRRSRPLTLATTGGLTAGYDKGFFIKSDDGNFLLKPAVQFQFRYVANNRDDVGGSSEEDSFTDGFEVRRARFRFDGNVLSPKLTYSFVWDTSRAGGAVSLLDAWAQYQLTPDLALKGGQFKESVFHERDVSGYQQLAVDRTLNDALLGGNITDRVQGVSLILGGTKDRPYRVEAAFHDGANSRNTNFQDVPTGASATVAAGATHWGAGVRGELKLSGDWANYKDFTAKGSKENLLVIGGGADYTDRAGNDVLLTTADVQYELADRLSVYGAVHADFTDPHDSTDNISRTDYGALVQAGYLLNKHWEVFGRYDFVKLDEDAVAAGAEDLFHEVTAGLNYYLGPDGSALHRAKFTIDVTYLPNGAPSDQTQSGILASDGDEFLLRAQFQLLL